MLRGEEKKSTIQCAQRTPVAVLHFALYIRYLMCPMYNLTIHPYTYLIGRTTFSLMYFCGAAGDIWAKHRSELIKPPFISGGKGMTTYYMRHMSGLYWEYKKYNYHDSPASHRLSFCLSSSSRRGPMPNAMQKRRSHKKSRRGCMNCKKWHTKVRKKYCYSAHTPSSSP